MTAECGPDYSAWTHSDWEAYGSATASDNCADPTPSVTNVEYHADDCYGFYVLTWSATDDCGNTGTGHQTIDIIDEHAPTIIGDPLVNIPCIPMALLEDTILVTATDNCDPDVTITVLSTDMVSGDCAGTYIKLYEAVDECGNVSDTFEQIVVMTDGVPPVVTISCPADATVESDADCNAQTSPLFTGGATATISDNCDPNPTLSPVSYLDHPMVYTGDDSDGNAEGCYTFIREWSATGTDWCDSTTTASCHQTITVIDLTDPTVHATDGTAECGTDYAAWSHDDWAAYGNATASDNCDTHVSIEVTGVSFHEDDCYGFYVLTWSATDDCGNTGTGHQTIDIIDTHAPTVHTTDMEAECGPDYGSWSHEDWADYGGATASDNCDEDIMPSVTGVSYMDAACYGQYVLTWTATDECGNSDTGTQTVTIVDNHAPVCPDADTTVCCPSEVPMPMAPAFTDNCDPNLTVTLTGADTTWDANCPTQGVIVRYWSAMDCSGNTTECSQTINIEDTHVPTFDYTCGYTDGEVIQICCETATEQDFLSYSCEGITWNDDCPGNVILEYTSDLDWDGGAVSGCSVSTPAPVEDGEVCTGFIPHALRLFNLPSGDKFFGLADAGTVTYIGDDAWSYEATFYVIDENDGSMSPDDGFTIDVLFDNGLDWNDWSNQDFPTGYKADCPLLIDEHESWLYYILNSGTLEGIGAYEGSSFALTHQPMNMFYGCQVGDGANNSNDNYGFSSWMLLDGTYSHYGMEMPFIGSGDVFGDLDCCAGGSYTQTVTLHDCGCNTNTLQWTVIATADGCDVIAEQMGGNAEESEVSVIGGNTDPVSDKFPISVLEVAPNPTDHATQVQFISSGAVRLVMDLIQMDGAVVMNLYNGDIHPNMIYTQNLVMDDLEAGMYQIRWATNSGSMTKKVLLTN